MKIPQHLNIAKAIEALEKSNMDAAWHLLTRIPTEMVVNEPAQQGAISPERIQELWTKALYEGEVGSSMPHAFAALLFAEQEHPEQLARLGWQYVECPDCGSEGARAFPRPEGQPAQRTWQGLTDEQIKDAVRGAGLSFTAPDFKVARAIEAKLRSKNI